MGFKFYLRLIIIYIHYFTKNGKGDLAVMSIEAYEQLEAGLDLYGMLKEGIDDVNDGCTRPFHEVMEDIRGKRGR